MSLIANIVGVESGGNPTAEGVPTKYGTATGKYQILDSTWNNYKGYKRAKDAPESVQDEFASKLLDSYVKKYGEAGAAVAWAGGPKLAAQYVKDPTNPKWDTIMVGGDTSIADYVAKTAGGQNMAVSTAQAGSVTSGNPDPKPSPQSSPAEVEAYIRKHYPDVAPFLANDEIRKILFDAAISPVEVAASEIEHQIRQTSYWQTHGSDSRAFDLLIGQDPAGAGKLVDDAKQTLADFFDQEGVRYTDSQLGDAAKKAIRAGWINTAGQIANSRALGDFAVFALSMQNPNGNLPAGATASTADQLAQIARQYMVPINRGDLEKAALNIRAGKLTVDQFTHGLLEQSSSLFSGSPDVQKRIQAGESPYSIFAPQRTAIGNYFEVDPNSIDLTDAKWADVLQMYDQQAKTSRPMTYGETVKWAMQNAPKNTQWYEQQDAAVANTLAKALGKVA